METYKKAGPVLHPFSSNTSRTAGKMIKLVLVVAASIVLAVMVRGNPNGAPGSACFNLHPNHGYPSQNITQPKFITIPAKNTIYVGETLDLTIQAYHSDILFRGYLLVALDAARQAGQPGYIGTFSQPSDGKVITCDGDYGVNNAVTHRDNRDKVNVTVKWTPPPDWAGGVEFMTTYVQNTATYWVNQYANYYVNVLREPIGAWCSPSLGPSNFQCPNDYAEGGNWPYPGMACSCAFYICAHGVPNLSYCPRDLYYNAANNTCDYKWLVPGC